MAANGAGPPPPVLAYQAAPLAVLAAARLTGAALELKADARLPKDAPPTLRFASG